MLFNLEHITYIYIIHIIIYRLTDWFLLCFSLSTQIILGDFYDFDVAEFYKVETQRKTMEDLVGSAKLAEKYIGDQKSSLWFAKGHLAPNADFLFETRELEGLQLLVIKVRYHKTDWSTQSPRSGPRSC